MSTENSSGIPPLPASLKNASRRDFLAQFGAGFTSLALSGMLEADGFFARPEVAASASMDPMRVKPPHLPTKAKACIFLFMYGGPSQMDLFDYKPELNRRHGQTASLEQRRRDVKPGTLLGSKRTFRQCGQSGLWCSDVLPHLSAHMDKLAVIKSLYADSFAHGSAMIQMNSGRVLQGWPSMGSWMSYGLGSENQNLPAFVVLLSKATTNPDQPLYAKLWSNGFMPSLHQGVVFRSGQDPVYYLNNPNGIDKSSRRNMLSALSKLSEDQYKQVLDPELDSRMKQYEMAYRMQSSVPETLDISKEPDSVFNMYGPDSRIPGTFAANCLLARKLAEKDVRFIQLYHKGWDHHGNLPRDIQIMAKSVDQASVALIKDLKQRGLLDDTLVVWGGEFGRTNYSQGKLTKENYGRDHHPRCFSIYMTGGGIKKGISYGETDEFGYNITKDPVHIHDLQATIMHLMGIDHEQLTFKFQGRRYRLTDVAGKVVKPILT
jgi:hypothetical protein